MITNYADSTYGISLREKIYKIHYISYMTYYRNLLKKFIIFNLCFIPKLIYANYTRSECIRNYTDVNTNFASFFYQKKHLTNMTSFNVETQFCTCEKI